MNNVEGQTTEVKQENVNLNEVPKELENELNNVDPDKIASNLKLPVKFPLPDGGNGLPIFKELNNLNLTGAREESYYNIIRNINPNKAIENLSMSDVYNLSDTQKADLARKLIAILPLSDGEKIIELQGKNRTLGQIDDALTSGYRIVNGENTIDDNAETISKDLFFGYARFIKATRQTKLLKTYESFYQSGKIVPVMPVVDVQATGDLTGTGGIGGGRNIGRQWFNYNNDIEKGNITTNSLCYGLDINIPMRLTVGAEGLDTAKGGKISISLTKENESYVIEGYYNGRQYQDSKLIDPGKFNFGTTNIAPQDIVVTDNQNGTYDIVIPPKYKGYNMSINTESIDTGGGRYDELSFPITINNGRIGVGGADNVYELEGEQLFNPGEYNLTGKGRLYYEKIFQEYSIYSNRTLATNIPIVFSGGVDATLFKDDPKLFVAQNKDILDTVDFSGSEKIQSFREEFQTQVAADTDFELTFQDTDQQKAQKLLLTLRTLQSLKILYENKDMREKIENGKFVLTVGDIRTDKKFVKAGVDGFSYIKK